MAEITLQRKPWKNPRFDFDVTIHWQILIFPFYRISHFSNRFDVPKIIGNENYVPQSFVKIRLAKLHNQTLEKNCHKKCPNYQVSTQFIHFWNYIFQSISWPVSNIKWNRSYPKRDSRTMLSDGFFHILSVVCYSFRN